MNLGQDIWAAFDTDLLRIPLVWKGEEGKPPVTPESMSTVSYIHATRMVYMGQNDTPKPLGQPFLANGVHEGWKLLEDADEQPLFTDPRTPGPTESEVGRGPLEDEHTGILAVQIHDHKRITLSYQFHGTKIVESWRLGEIGGNVSLIRTFELDAHEQPLAVALSAAVEGSVPPSRAIDSNGQELVAHEHQGVNYLVIPAAQETVAIEVIFETGIKSVPDGRPDTRSVPWTQTSVTSAILSEDQGAYVMDDIPLPHANPWRRNPRLADIAFLNDKGDAAAVTFDGDVWLISGLTGDMGKIEWRRYASGLHEPMSIVLREMPGMDEGLFVFDRNGIWRLLDTTGDGLVDEHEMFCNRFGQTAETREYANSMKLAPDGSFVISKGGQQGATLGKDSGKILRVSPDGRTVETLSWGFRQPFVGVHPETGLITASDQQGNYVPATPIYVIRENQYHGFIPSILPDNDPAPIADPLTWIPHPVNPSAITQVWAMDPRFGPLAGSCIIIGFNRPELLRIVINPRFEKPQGAAHSLSRDMEFAPLNGTMNPADGQLYVTGFQNFATTASRVSGLARYRYTGTPSAVLVECTPMTEGILLKFDSPLDEATAGSLSAYSAERWNYQRTRRYGSPHLQLDGTPGSEWMTPSSVYLSDDRKSVFVGLPDMRAEVMQMRIGWGLKAANGADLTDSAYFTPHELASFDPEREGFGPLQVDLTARVVEREKAAEPTAAEGKRIYEMIGCMACHSIDGTDYKNQVGPTFLGLHGRERVLTDGSKVTADDDYLRESILDPGAKVPMEFKDVAAGMPIYEGILTDAQIESLILYIKSL